MFEFLTSESVCAGHPDKLADQISDAILDAALARDPKARVAAETLLTKEQIVLAGEITTTAKIDPEAIAREVIRSNGYTNPAWDFTDKSPVIVRLQQQSPDIAAGVDTDGAGDQGITYGYATSETPEFLPLPLVIAHDLTRGLDDLRTGSSESGLRPDGKAQVTVRYDDQGTPIEVVQVTLAAPHDESITNDQLKVFLYENTVVPALQKRGMSIDISRVVVNGTGVWHYPGPAADTGLTGRKIVVDSYGGACPVGGGAFSGKDPSKVDRSGAYAARFIAKNIVAQGLAKRATVQLGWIIGLPEPVGLDVELIGATMSKEEIITLAKSWLTLSVRGIKEGLDLCRPIYKQTATYGHFSGASYPWEKLL